MTDPAQLAAVPPPEAWPTVDDVAAHMRARTQDINGKELGTFTDATRPTDQEVSLLIASAAQAVASELTADVPIALYGSFSLCAIEMTACMIEKSYFPEQISAARSPYDQHWEQYLRYIEALKDRIPEGGAGGLAASGIGNLGLVRPYQGRCCDSGLGSPPQFANLECATVNYDDPWC
jgi:hypothetical protein